ncbi:hypothetical protein [Nocardiopsis sp. HUAS JQ3]|nr:hypothetical protein [Nocardiopsis sp. HUAS JQ3]WDZ90612.1 hypothetical protein PV789_27620 [Nocardiopsis sp. HUAS JQ3]
MNNDTAYEAPSITDLGEFTAETGAGLGDEAEGWWPLADRA